MSNSTSNGDSLVQESSLATATQTFQSTLNGYDQATAIQMIQCFKKNCGTDNNPKSLSAWYSMDDITNIYNLIDAEAQVEAIDGIRLYFGCESPATVGDPLSLSILMISTADRVPPANGASNHGDYYSHTDAAAAYLADGPIGLPETGSENDRMLLGASYYGSMPADANCTDSTGHYINTPQAYGWVNARKSLVDNSPITTWAEWFPFPFIADLFYSIINAPAGLKLDGLRIYLGKGNALSGDVHDVLILVPTYTDTNGNHTDYNGCLDNLLKSAPWSASAAISSNGLAAPALSAADKEAVSNNPSWYSGGYDNGELCPTHCQ